MNDQGLLEAIVPAQESGGLITWPGIEKTPEIVGRAARIAGTRIPVWVLVNWRRLGWTEAKILENYPTLRAVNLVNAWAYADAHHAEIDREILENEAAFKKLDYDN
jgi:uncharacterized protein (DUF433 family)